MLNAVETYGGVCRIVIGVRPFILVTDPAAVHQITLNKDGEFRKARDLYDKLAKAGFGDGLVTSEGESWEEHHRLLLKWFQPSIRTLHIDTINYYANQLCDSIEKDIAATGGSATYDMEHKMCEVMLSLFGRIAFNYDLDSASAFTREFLDVIGKGAKEVNINMLYDMVTFAHACLYTDTRQTNKQTKTDPRAQVCSLAIPAPHKGGNYIINGCCTLRVSSQSMNDHA